MAFLAAQTGHTLVRINNHEQTDLQEYLGSYISNETGKLVFREGALVQAVRKGHWLLLDELNLAPSQVLEALNRFASFVRCLLPIWLTPSPTPYLLPCRLVTHLFTHSFARLRVHPPTLPPSLTHPTACPPIHSFTRSPSPTHPPPLIHPPTYPLGGMQPKCINQASTWPAL